MDEELVYGPVGTLTFDLNRPYGGTGNTDTFFEALRQREGLTHSGESLSRFELIRGLARTMGVEFDPLALFSPDSEGRMEQRAIPFIPLSKIEVQPGMRDRDTYQVNITIPF